MPGRVSQGGGPLSDVRVLEAGQLLAGPFCGQLLADFGAEVIKLEEPTRGDPMREWGQEKPHGLSLWWPVVARGKKSVTCNLRTTEGQELVRRLAADADVLVENFRPGTLECWGLGYDELTRINPGLVLVRVTGFGQSGPYAKRAGFGSIGEAMGGIRYVNGDPGSAPSRVGISIGDSLGGTFAAYGALVALHARRATGQGQVVDAAIYEAVLAMMESLIPEYAIGGYTRERTGATLPNIAPSNVYPTADEEMVLIAANQDMVFRRLATVMDQPDLAAEERFGTHTARGTGQQELDALIAEWTATLKADALLSLLEENGIPAGRIYKASDMLDDPHFQAREDIIRLPHDALGSFPMHGVFPRLSGTPGRVSWVGPELGQHNEEVYGGLLGLGVHEQAGLHTRGVI